MKKRMIVAVIAVIMVFAIGMTSAFAVQAGEKRAVIAADLTDDEISKIYDDFEVSRGSVTELRVTNSDEREYLEGLVDDAKIGNVALSCVYIETLEEGSGLKMSIMNIKWCTTEMYQNALTTAGITDARVKISAPHAVSGTAALTGIYKAYEDITGQKLDETAKSAAAEELVITGELGELIGNQSATELVNQLKSILDETQNMTDDEVKSEIVRIAKDNNYELTDAQVKRLLELCRSLEGLDTAELQKRVEALANTLNTANKAQETVTVIGEKIRTFFSNVGNFFTNLFGGNKS